MKSSIRIFRNSENHTNLRFAFFWISRNSSWSQNDAIEVSESSSHQQSNHGLCGQKTPNKPPDDASNVCKSSKTCTFWEFLMIILTNFCSGTTFHHLWDHKILSKRDDWILHVSQFRFGNRSRIENKLYVYTQTVQFSIYEYWTSIAQMVVTLSEEHEIPGSNQSMVPKITYCYWLLGVTRFEYWFNFQNAHKRHVIIKCRMLCIYCKLHRAIWLQWKWMVNEH